MQSNENVTEPLVSGGFCFLFKYLVKTGTIFPLCKGIFSFLSFPSSKSQNLKLDESVGDVVVNHCSLKQSCTRIAQRKRKENQDILRYINFSKEQSNSFFVYCM